ncbi:MAG TPA: acetylornithine deacetylase [Burkholderiales bacterium]|nr:acetylornithine deacetylase [Burkholderiales bacterium]
MQAEPVLPIRTETWDMIQRLIAFDTTSRESNLGLIEWVRDWLERQGVESRLTYDATGKKANLFATVGGGSRPGIVLSGHTDVVPVDGQAWDTDPFKATLDGERIYARGSVDMKSFIGVALAHTPKFLAANLDAPVHFALSYDEEVGCIGVRGLLEDLVRNDIRPAGCIVGEPTGMQPVIAHKGMRSFKCRVHGKEAHSSLTTQGVNAIEYAAKLILFVRQLAERMRDLEARDYNFDVPFTTLQTGLIKGGTAPNIVPRECQFHFEFRYLPGVDPDALEAEIRDYARNVLEPEMRKVDASVGIEIDTKSQVPGLSTTEAEEIAKLAQRLARAERLKKVAYATEAGLFQQAGIPSIICGPGSIEQAHKPNEFITLEQVALCESFMDRLTATLSR